MLIVASERLYKLRIGNQAAGSIEIDQTAERAFPPQLQAFAWTDILITEPKARWSVRQVPKVTIFDWDR